MLWNTYEKVTKLFEAANGYLSASEVRREKITTVQIRELIEKGTLERVSHGYYWFRGENNRKPENYEMIEACMVNQHAVICADSVCYYLGLTPYKPRKLSVATLKTDRSKMSLNFPVTRRLSVNSSSPVNSVSCPKTVRFFFIFSSDLILLFF